MHADAQSHSRISSAHSAAHPVVSKHVEMPNAKLAFPDVGVFWGSLRLSAFVHLPSQEKYEEDGNPFNIRHHSTVHNAEDAHAGNPFAPMHTPRARPQGMQGPFGEPFRDPSTAGTASMREQSTAGEPLLAQSNLCLMPCARTF